jgi:hypothetical protein
LNTLVISGFNFSAFSRFTLSGPESPKITTTPPVPDSINDSAWPDGGFLQQILENSGGFESCLAGKKYFLRAPNSWRISGGFAQFCMALFLTGGSGGFGRFWSLYLQKTTFFSLFLAFFNTIIY